jgi:DNA-binding NarL/FixJ family response regulator
MERVWTPPRVLLVEPDPTRWPELRQAGRSGIFIERCTLFTEARHRLMSDPPALLVTNLRLGAYNGLHLVYLVTANRYPTRTIVYSTHQDLPLIEEAQSIGAFYETSVRLVNALPAYLHAKLPQKDRRSPARIDRRQMFRGGRRAADVAVTA